MNQNTKDFTCSFCNKTREEVARSYVTKDEMESNMDRLIRMLNKLETKLDKLFEVKTN